MKKNSFQKEKLRVNLFINPYGILCSTLIFNDNPYLTKINVFPRVDPHFIASIPEEDRITWMSEKKNDK